MPAMEFIAEILLDVCLGLLQFLGELLLQLAAEWTVGAAGHAARRRSSRPGAVPPWISITVWLAAGAAAGWVSLQIFPVLMIDAEWMRIANVVLTPVVAGLVMGRIGTWRKHRDMEVLRLESFACGFSFAFTMALVRYAHGV